MSSHRSSATDLFLRRLFHRCWMLLPTLVTGIGIWWFVQAESPANLAGAALALWGTWNH